MRRLLGLAGLIVAGVVFVTLFLDSFSQYDALWGSSADFFDKFLNTIGILWTTVYQPLLLLIVSAIALEGK